MKNAYLLLAISCLSLFGCKKDRKNIQIPSQISVNGISDITVERDSSSSMMVSVELDSGKQEVVSLSISGLPENVKASYTSQSGTTDYITTVKFTATDDAVLGAYPLKLSAATATSTKSYDMTLNIVATECAAKRVGTYVADETCDNLTTNIYSVVVTKSTVAGNRILFQNLFDNGNFAPIYADMECGGRAFSIPTQSFDANRKVSGTGTYNNNAMTVNYTITNQFSAPISCTIKMEMQ